jgi:hypothetical protein
LHVNGGNYFVTVCLLEQLLFQGNLWTWVGSFVYLCITSGWSWLKAIVKFYKFYFFFSFILYLALALPALPCPLPCKTDRTAGAWVGHVIRCVILKMWSVGLLPLGDESLVSKHSWEASCMSVVLKKRDLFFGERFSPFILVHRQNRFYHRKCRGRFCWWIKMQNWRVGQTHRQMDKQVNLYIRCGTDQQQAMDGWRSYGIEWRCKE